MAEKSKKKPKTLNANRPETWTQTSLQEFMQDSGNTTKPLYLHVYDWTDEEYEEAKKLTLATLEKKEVLKLTRFPNSKHQKTYPARQAAEFECAHNHQGLFCKRSYDDEQGTEQPGWYYPELFIEGRENNESQKHKDFGFTIGYVFAAHVVNLWKKSNKSNEKVDEAVQKQTHEAHFGRDSVDLSPTKSTPIKRAHRSYSQGSSHSAASTMGGLASSTKRTKLAPLTSQHDEDENMFDRPPRPLREKKPLDRCQLHIAHVDHDDSKDELLCSQRRYAGRSLLDPNGTLKLRAWDNCQTQIGQAGDKLFYFLGDKLYTENYNIFGLESAILALHENMSNSGNITIFVAMNKDVVQAIPADRRDFGSQTDLEFTIPVLYQH